jgi:hypothetical protein
MKERIYWLIPDLADARRTVSDLQLAGVDTKHIHLAAREGVDMRGLHEANVWQTSDLAHAVQTGLLIGSALGIGAGLLAALYLSVSPASSQWQMAAVLAVLGGVIGAWSSSMIGISIPSPRLARFEGSIEAGQILLMVDLPAAQMARVTALLHASHPEAHFEGADRLGPAFP